jgi:glycosyltransferase involved in cell wall biosynthesis
LKSLVKHIGNEKRDGKIKMSKSLVSIIIPVYNRESLLPDTLQNILDNHYRPLEVLLVDDGSTDSSLQIMKDFKVVNESENLIIKIFEQENLGAPVARNHGLENARGEYIQFLDSDDLIDPDKFSVQIQMMKKNRADFGLCDFLYINRKGNKAKYQSNAGKLEKVINSNGSFGCGSPLLRRDLTFKVNWNPELYRQQDVDFFLKAALLAKKIAYVNKPLYLYVSHDKERISNCYNKSKEVYLQRIKSLLPIFQYRYNITHTIKAIFHLSYSHFRYVIVMSAKKHFLN